jgi:tetratricopeptide (TPR) repeat protein
MRSTIHRLFLLWLVLVCAVPGFAAQGAKKSSPSSNALRQSIDELNNNPSDKALREKILRTAAGMKSLPALPEEVQRHMARGTAFAQKATDLAGYQRAIEEFEAAVNAAPWLPLAYFNLAVMQEKAGLFDDSIQNLKYYLIGAPDAKNSREVKNKIYALEAEAEAVQAGMKEPAAGGGAAQAGKQGVGPTLEIEPDKQLRVIKMTPDKKARTQHFAGNWYFKESIRGEEVTIHAFEIARSENGDLTIVPPKRAADSVASINIFQINDRSLKLQMKWKMKSVVGYWKTETYVLTLSEDGSKMSGSHNQQSVGGRNIDLDRVLFRQ